MALIGVDYCLDLIGLEDDEQRQRIMNNGLADFKDFCIVTEDDIGDMAKVFGKRTVTEESILFGYGRIKRLKSLMHGVQDKLCCSDPINHKNFTLDEMNEATKRTAARKVKGEQSKTTSKVAEPSKFTKKAQWPSFY